MQEIHALISAVKFSSIEIKTANFLRSYGDGLMAVVSGLVQRGQYEKRRKFIQAFFLAPQDSGYYILNDLFHYVDEEYFCNPDVLAQSSYENLTKSQPASEAGTIWFSFFLFRELRELTSNDASQSKVGMFSLLS